MSLTMNDSEVWADEYGLLYGSVSDVIFDNYPKLLDRSTTNNQS